MSDESISVLTRLAEAVAPDDVDLVEPIFQAALKGGKDWNSLHRRGSESLHGAVLPLGEPSVLVYIIDFLKDHGQAIKDILSSAAAISTVVRNAQAIASGGEPAPSAKSTAADPHEQAVKDLNSSLTAALAAYGLKPEVAADKSRKIIEELDKDRKASAALVEKLSSSNVTTK